ncbi:hypothetical protein PENTCL1PPCAC_21150, partial [Pristionchus entomophagus]
KIITNKVPLLARIISRQISSRDRVTMLKLLFIFWLIQIVHCSCPSGFELVRDGECRGKSITMNSYWDEVVNAAITKCKEIQAHPVIIHTEEQQSYWANQASAEDAAKLVMGLVCNSTTKRWTWTDGSALDYKPPTFIGGCGDILNTNCDARTWNIMHDGTWDCWLSDHRAITADIYCTTQLQQPVPAADGCDGFDDDSEDGVCYQVGATAETWQEAQMNCKHFGGNLASIHNLQENSFVRRLAVSNGAMNGVFLGATTSGKGKDYGWVDGSEWDYENFHPGFPLDGFGDCIAMDTSLPAGQWMNKNCSANLPVACIRDQKEVVQPSCNPGPWKEDTLITSPGFPFNASTFWDYFLTVEAGKKVEVEIIFLEANSCCD